MTVPVLEQDIPRPKDVGVLGMEVYFPYRVSVQTRLKTC